jgi:hypothetical protein
MPRGGNESDAASLFCTSVPCYDGSNAGMLTVSSRLRRLRKPDEPSPVAFLAAGCGLVDRGLAVA